MSVGGSGYDDDNMYPNILEVLEHIGMHSSNTEVYVFNR